MRRKMLQKDAPKASFAHNSARVAVACLVPGDGDLLLGLRLGLRRCDADQFRVRNERPTTEHDALQRASAAHSAERVDRRIGRFSGGGERVQFLNFTHAWTSLVSEVEIVP